MLTTTPEWSQTRRVQSLRVIESDSLGPPVPGATDEGLEIPRRRWLTFAPVAVLIALAGFTTYVFWPGHMSSDTLSQIESVRTGRFFDWHAGVLMALWRPFWLVGVGVTAVFFASVCTFVLGLYSTLRVAFGRAGATAATVVLVVTPQIFGYLGYFGRDQWFASLLMAAIGAISFAARSSGRARRVGMVIAFIALCLMLAARQNGFGFGFPIAVALVGVVLAEGDSAPGAIRALAIRAGHASRLTRGAYYVVSGVVVLIAAVLVNTGVARLAGVERTHPEQAVYLFDLATMSARRGEVLLPPEVFPAQDVRLLRQTYNPYSVEPLLFGDAAILEFPVGSDQVSVLRSRWLDAVRADPIDYLRGRWKTWTRQIGWSGHVWWIFHPYVDPNPWGYEIEHDAVNDVMQEYMTSFTSDPWLGGNDLFRIWPYLLVCCGGLVMLRRRSDVRLVGWACAGALAHESTLFLGTMGVQYRYNYPVVLVALITASIGMRSAWQAVIRRRDGLAPAVDDRATDSAPS